MTKSFALDSIIVTVANTTVHLANYAVVAGIAAFFGATWQTDAFFLALTFPSFFVGAIVNAVGSVFIPIFADCKVSRPQILGQLIGSALLYAVAGTLFIVIVIGITALGISHWLLSDSTTLAFRKLAIQQTLLMSPVIVIQTSTGILSAFYNANGRFLIPPATDAISTFAVLVIVVVFKSSVGIFSVPLGFVCGAALHLILLMAFWSRFKVHVVWTWTMEPDLQRTLSLSLPLILGTAALQFGALISRFLAAQLSEGSVTILDYASRISYAVMELLTSGVLLVILTKWSQKFSTDDLLHFKQEIQNVIQMSLFLIVPIVAVLLAMRRSVVAIAFQRGSFNAVETAATASVLLYFLLGIPVDVVSRIYVRLFLIWKNTWIIGSLAAIRVCITIIVALMLVGRLGLRGLAIADTMALVSITAILIYLAIRRIGNPLLETWFSILKIIVSATCAGIVAVLTSKWVDSSGLLGLLIPGMAAAIIYVAVSRVVQREQLRKMMIALNPYLLTKRISS